jgi:cytochrome c553
MRIVGHHLTFATLFTMLACGPGGHMFAQSLAWDATLKHYDAQRGETNVILVFNVTNISSSEVSIKAVRPSCGCTIAKMPTLPWRLAPNDHGQLKIDVDLRGRQGLLTKTIDVDTSAGTNVITVDVKLPELDPREKNRLVAFADRQAVFKGDCARCHLAPAAGKTGKELFKAICAICHEAEHRAEMVPDLAALKKPTDKAFWIQTLRIGKPGTFMPAFSKPFGGPLNDDAMASLVTYLMDRFPPASAADIP